MRTECASQYSHNRLSQVTAPNSGNTYFGYDANDNLASVKDPRALTTSYVHNGYGDVKSLASPDAGTTTSTYDSGGNLATATDARSAIATYQFSLVQGLFRLPTKSEVQPKLM